MNWKDLPLNTSKLYLQNELVGNCTIYIPIPEEATLVEIDKVRNELQHFINWQRWATTHGNDIA